MPFSAYNKIRSGIPHWFASIIIQNRGKRKGILLFPRFYFSAVILHPVVSPARSGVCMIDIKAWLNMFTNKMGTAFSSRIWFIGLQGSYGWGEATATSDIILNELDIAQANTSIHERTAFRHGYARKGNPWNHTAPQKRRKCTIFFLEKRAA